MAPLFGTTRRSRTMPSLNPSVIPRANENTDLARVVMVVRKARARNGGIAIRNWTTPLHRHEKRRAGNQNEKTATLTASQSETDKNPKPATMTATKTKTKTKIGRRNEGSGPSQDRKNRKAESNLRTRPPPPRPTPVANPMTPSSVSGSGVHPPSQDRSRKPRNPLGVRHLLHRLKNTITRARGPLMCTGRYDPNVRPWGGPRHHAQPVRVSSSVTTKGPSTRRIVCILGSG